MGSGEAATDLDLVRRIKAGDERAFEEMVSRYNARVYSLSYGVLRNAQDAEEAIQSDVAARELAARAGEFIAELPPAYRDVIWMNDVEGMTAPEIAETLEISIPAFKSRLHRARLAVRQRLAEVAGARIRAEAAG